MRMNRRNVLVGLGTIVAGGGAALGTGAFSSVNAERSVHVDVTGDSGALLGLIPNEDSSFVNNSDNTLSIDLGAGNMDGTGVNRKATTKIEPGFTVRNNGSQPVYVSVEGLPNLADDNIDITFEADKNSLTSDSDTDLEGTIEVPVGYEFDVNIIINTADNETGFDDNITLSAENSGDAEATAGNEIPSE